MKNNVKEIIQKDVDSFNEILYNRITKTIENAGQYDSKILVEQGIERKRVEWATLDENEL